MGASPVEYEEQKVRLDRTLSLGAVARLLIEAAEYRGWELHRLRRYRDGTRDAWMRRKIIRVRPTLPERTAGSRHSGPNSY